MTDRPPRNSIQTRHGHFVRCLVTEEVRHTNKYTIEDISTALSRVCRFSGHTTEFYSVAEHCLWVERHLEEREDLSYLTYKERAVVSLHALLHDAPEAYIGDIPTPFKRLLSIQDETDEPPVSVSVAEDLLYEDMLVGLGVPEASAGTRILVLKWDMLALLLERRHLMVDTAHIWPAGIKEPARTLKVSPMGPENMDEVAGLYKCRFLELMKRLAL